MKILVTGGAGFIASHIVDKCIEKNHEVIIIDNLSTGKKENINAQAIFYHADITNQEQLNNIFQKENPQIVIHAAANALLRESIENPLKDATINILGTINVLEACKNNNIKKIIYTSTGGARVGEPKYLPVDENHPIEPLSPYGISKHTAEHYVKLYANLYDMDYFIFCFGNVYGPRDLPDSKRLIPFFIDAILKKLPSKIFGDGEQTRDFIYVDDLAQFMVHSMDKIGKTPHQLFHLANGTQISVNTICALLKKITNKNIQFEKSPPIKGEVRDIVLDITLAQKELGWKPTTLIEAGLQKTYDWFKEIK